jgi:hypothetical protein
MAKIEVKKVQAIDDREPHWEAIVSYGAYEVNIPLPARDLIGDDPPTQRRQSIEAVESLAKALLDFAAQTRKRWPHDWD